MRLVPTNAQVARNWRLIRSSPAVSAAIAALAVMPLAAGCQAAGTAAGGSGARPSVITVAAIPGVDDAPLYIAARSGAFRRAGLNVTIRTYQSAGQELQALNSGRVDVAAGDYADFFYAEANTAKPDLRIIADGYDAAPGTMEVLTLPDSGISTPKDLQGKIIGTPQPQEMPVRKGVPYSLETVATESVLVNDGVDPTKVTWDPLPSGDLINALAHHQVNAILVQEPYIYDAAARLGTFEVLDSCSGSTASLPLSGYFAIDSFVRKYPQALRAFRSTLQQAQASAVLHGPVRNVLASYPGMSTQSASLVTIGAYPTLLDAASVSRLAGLMFNTGVLVKTLNVAGMIFH
jgi:NitT/TauT family transport system substrate-binding protein